MAAHGQQYSQLEVQALKDELGISYKVANELLITAGGDYFLAVDASASSSSLSEAKARIINERLTTIEEMLNI